MDAEDKPAGLTGEQLSELINTARNTLEKSSVGRERWLNEHGEFKRYLVTFLPDTMSAMSRDSAAWCAWPWVFEWEPDDNVLTTLDGLYELGAFKNLPSPWREWKRARHKTDQWAMTNGPSRAQADAAIRKKFPIVNATQRRD